jgi:transposase
VFKDEVPGLAERIGVPAAAKELGLQNTQLYSWRTKAKKNASQSDIERAQATEIARLKRQLAEQAEELAIVKKPQHTSQRV